MSSSVPSGAGYRLFLHASSVRLERLGDRRGAVERPAPDAEAYGAALREMAAGIDGPVVAVLPADVFRVLAVADRPVDRLLARPALARALGVGPLDIVVRQGAAGPDGSVCHVATTRGTLRETRDYLAAHGVALAAVEPDAELPGFVAPPRFAVGADIARDRLRAWLAGTPVLRRPVPAAVLAGVALLAFVAVSGGGDPSPPVVVGSGEVLPAAPLVADEPPAIEAALAQPLAPRPRKLPPLSLLTSAAPQKRPAPSALAAAAGEPEAVPPITLASRSVPPEIRGSAAAVLQAPPLPLPEPLRLPAAVAASESLRTAALGPIPRPRPAGEAPEADAPAAAGAIADPGRPLRRPDAPRADLAPPPAEATGAPGEPAVVRPVARPAGAVEAEIVAAVTESHEVPITLAALPPGAAALASSPAARPAPRRLAPEPAQAAPAPQPVRAAPRPAPVQAARQSARAQAPQPVRAQAPQPARVQAAPQPVWAQPAPQPQRAARVQPTPQPQRQAAPAPAASQPVVRGEVSLIGVFGSANSRHALLRMPNGNVQRVRAGESVAGVQVAAVSGDSVRVRVNGRDAVLRLPD